MPMKHKRTFYKLERVNRFQRLRGSLLPFGEIRKFLGLIFFLAALANSIFFFCFEIGTVEIFHPEIVKIKF